MRPLPQVTAADAPFWRALRRSRVEVQRCNSCGTHRFPATRYCAKCRSEESEWVAVAPSGTLETWCVFHRPYFDALPVPYTVIQVKLDCGVRVFSNPSGVATSALRIGMPVTAVFEDIAPDVTLLKFKPKDGP
ncbi:MAG: Zn-ribbon domain-containing OB-fold protein [Casimicrobiaceae bacterium]